jgi:hypothetical protein
MRVCACCCASWILSVLLVSAAPARDIHVDNRVGDDTATGRLQQTTADRTGPVRSIAKALELASPGDRIVLKNTGEPYRESVSLVGRRHSGLAVRPFVIEGNGAILDGSAPVPPEAWEHYKGPVFRFRPRRLAHQQLFLDDRPLTRVAVVGDAGNPPDLGPLQWCLYGGHVYFSIEPDTTKLPQDYALTHTCKRVGITLFHVEQVAIVDLTVQGFQLDGISACNSARGVTLAGVTCRGNGRSGITVGGASRVEIDGSLVGNNGSAQLLTRPWSETKIRNTALLSNTAQGWVDEGGRVSVDGNPVQGGLKEVVPEAPPRAIPQ